MRAAKSFTEILDLRGRIVLFTPTAAIGLRFEQQAERNHAQVIHTRGWADPSARCTPGRASVRAVNTVFCRAIRSATSPACGSTALTSCGSVRRAIR